MELSCRKTSFRAISCATATRPSPARSKITCCSKRRRIWCSRACCSARTAIDCHHAFIYIRGEFKRGYEIFCAALEEARAAGCVGKNIFGTGYDLEVTVHRGAGAYICGEETGAAQLARRQARRAAAEAAVSGDRGSLRRADGRQQRRDAGLSRADSRTRAGVVRGRRHRAQQRLQDRFDLRPRAEARQLRSRRSARRSREMIEIAGGLRPGRKFMAVQPGGGSSACIFEEHLDLPYDYETMAKAGSMLGSGAFVVFDDTTDFVKAALQPGALLSRTNRAANARRAAKAGTGSNACSHRFVEGRGVAGDFEMIRRVAPRRSPGSISARSATRSNRSCNRCCNRFPEQFEARIVEGTRDRMTIEPSSSSSRSTACRWRFPRERCWSKPPRRSNKRFRSTAITPNSGRRGSAAFVWSRSKACRSCRSRATRRLPTAWSCTRAARRSMRAARMVLELLLVNHPLDCPICDKGGECDLQDYAMAYGRGTSDVADPKSRKPKGVDLGPTIVLDEERCVVCQRCVRFDDIIADERQLVVKDRGAQRHHRDRDRRAVSPQLHGKRHRDLSGRRADLEDVSLQVASVGSAIARRRPARSARSAASSSSTCATGRVVAHDVGRGRRSLSPTAGSAIAAATTSAFIPRPSASRSRSTVERQRLRADRLGRRVRAVGEGDRSARARDRQRRRDRRRTPAERRGIPAAAGLPRARRAQSRLARAVASGKRRPGARGGRLRRARTREGRSSLPASSPAELAPVHVAARAQGQTRSGAKIVTRHARRCGCDARARDRRRRGRNRCGTASISQLGQDVRADAFERRCDAVDVHCERTAQRARRRSDGHAADRTVAHAMRAMMFDAARNGKLAALSLFGVNPVRNAPDRRSGARSAARHAVRRRERAVHDRDRAARDARAARPRARSRRAGRRSISPATCCRSMPRSRRRPARFPIWRCSIGLAQQFDLDAAERRGTRRGGDRAFAECVRAVRLRRRALRHSGAGRAPDGGRRCSSRERCGTAAGPQRMMSASTALRAASGGSMSALVAMPDWVVVLIKSAILLARRRDDVRVRDARRAQGARLDAAASRARTASDRGDCCSRPPMPRS